MLASFSILIHVPIDTEQEMLGYGIGVILLNIGMYFVAPAVLFTVIKKKLKNNTETKPMYKYRLTETLLFIAPLMSSTGIIKLKLGSGRR